ncbi:MAG: hypothetical protein U0521_04610 [Anaerolineae bacterium]
MTPRDKSAIFLDIHLPKIRGYHFMREYIELASQIDLSHQGMAEGSGA